MRKRTFTSSASALLLLTATLVSAKHASHDHLDILHRRHRATRQVEPRSTSENGEAGVEIRALAETTSHKVEKRAGTCQFPTDAGLVPVTMGAQNAGWAMSPDQPCKPGNYCPYACPPGQVSMQWDPSATSYTYPKSMVSNAEKIASRSSVLMCSRMVDCIATITEIFRSHFLIGRTAKAPVPISVYRTERVVSCRSAKPSFPATKPC